MKIIFLDIDGVLNYNNFKKETTTGSMFVSDEKIKILKKIVDETNAKIVLSSTWRIGWKHHELGLDSDFAKDYLELKSKLEEYGIELYSKTPILDKYMRKRGEEIALWLENNKDVDGYVVIDDLPGKYIRPCSSHLLQTSTWEGLREKHIKVAKRIIEKNTH